MAPQNPGIGLRYAGQIASSCRDRTGIGRSRLAQQPRAGKTELPDMQNAKSIGIRPNVCSMKKKNECRDSAVARASTESPLAKTGSSARAERLAANVARAMMLKAGGSGEFTASFS